MNEPTLEQQIADQEETVRNARIEFHQEVVTTEEAKLASLKRLQAIMDVKLPERPLARRPDNIDGQMYECAWDMGYVHTDDYDALLVYAQAEHGKRVDAEERVKELKPDAKRYRWLVDNKLGAGLGMPEAIFGDDLDAAIDQAMTGDRG